MSGSCYYHCKSVNVSLALSKIIKEITVMDIFNSNNSSGDQLFYPQTNPVTGQVIFVKHEDHEFLKSFKDNFIFYLLMAAGFAVLFTFCVYHNFSGVTTMIYPFVAMGYIILCAGKIGITIKKKAVFNIVAISLLAVNLFLTQDYLLLFLDHLAILFLVVAMSLSIFYDDSSWGLGMYIGRIFELILGLINHLFMIFDDGSKYRQQHSKVNRNPVLGYVFVGIIIATPLLFLVLILLGSADYFFGEFLINTIIKPFGRIRINNLDIIVMLLTSLFIAYAFVRKLCTHDIKEEIAESSKCPAAIAITINTILGLVYVIFSGFQIFTLFLGNGQLPEDYTYAEYAREGFFQLVVVCIINMILVLISLYLFEKSKILKASLLIISACTYIMIASSTFRMYMYVSVYQLTYTRLFVFWALLVIFMAMNGIAIFIFNEKFNLFRYCMIMVTVLYIGFAYMKPEAIIARNNLSEKFYLEGECQDIDYNYLKKLSSDATPAMVKAFERENDKYGMEYVIKKKLKENEFANEELSIRQFNMSVYMEYLCR